MVLNDRDRGALSEACSADRAGRFLGRLDAHLPTLADDTTRRNFLDRQLEGWEHRYARFVSTQGASEPPIAREDGRQRLDADNPADPPQAADFLLTITGLAARRAAAIAREPPNAHVTRGDHV